MSALRDLFYKVGFNVNDKGLKDADRSIDKLDKKAQSFGKTLQNMGTKAQEAGANMTAAFTVPLMALGALGIKTFASYDDSIRKVWATAGATEEQFKQLDKTARDLGRTTRFTNAEAAEAMNFLALAGWDTNRIIGATPGILSLASAAGTDLAQTSDIISDNMSVFSLHATEANRVADMFAQTQRRSNTTVLLLGESYKYAGGAAASAGMDIAQTNAILGLFANQGLKGSRAGTVFASMLSDLRKKAGTAGMTIGNTRVAIYDAAGQMRDMATIMGDIEQATKGMTAAQRDQIMMNYFGTESMRGVNAYLTAGSESYNTLEHAIRNSTGVAVEMTGVMEGGIGGALRRMGSAISGFFTEIGEIAAPYVIIGAEAVDRLANAFSDLPEPVQQAIVGFGTAIAAAGPTTWAFGYMSNTLGGLVTQISLVYIAFKNKFAKIGSFIASPFVAINKATRGGMESLKDFAKTLLFLPLTMFKLQAGAPRTAFQLWFADLRLSFVIFIQNTLSLLSGMGKAFAGTKIGKMLLWPFQKLLAAGIKLSPVFGKLAVILKPINLIALKLTGVGVVIAAVGGFVLGLVRNFDEVKEKAKEFGGFFKNAFKNFAQAIREPVNALDAMFAGTAIGEILNNFDGVFMGMVDKIFSGLKTATGGFFNLLATVIGYLPGIIEKVSQWLSVAWDYMQKLYQVGGGSNLIEGLKTLAGSVWNLVVNLGTALWPVLQIVGKLLGVVAGIVITVAIPVFLWFANIAVWLANALVNAFTWAVNTIGDVFTHLNTIFGGVIDFIAGIFTGDWQRAWQGVQNIFVGIINTIGSIFESFINGAIKLINGLLGGVNKIAVTLGLDEISLIQEVQIGRLNQVGGANVDAVTGAAPRKQTKGLWDKWFGDMFSSSSAQGIGDFRIAEILAAGTEEGQKEKKPENEPEEFGGGKTLKDIDSGVSGVGKGIKSIAENTSGLRGRRPYEFSQLDEYRDPVFIGNISQNTPENDAAAKTTTKASDGGSMVLKPEFYITINGDNVDTAKLESQIKEAVKKGILPELEQFFFNLGAKRPSLAY